jgi:hypothetical protein
MADQIQRRPAADGFADLRFSDGFVFQLLDVVAELGAATAVRGRRVRAPR